MSITAFSIRRPITVLMIVCGIILLGIISWNRLPQELFPPITYPQITVVTNYENAAPEEIEALISSPIEETVGSVTNIRRINSTSREGTSMVVCEFNWGTNMDIAALNVREKIDLIKDKLPREAEEPIVMKYNPFELPIIVLSVTGRDIAPYDLKELCRRQIKDMLEKIEGVAKATLVGGREREILIELNQHRLRAFGVSIISIIDLLKKTNLNYPAGTIETSFYEYLVRTIGEFKAVDEMKDVPMILEEEVEQEQHGQQVPAEERKKEKKRRLIYLRDIAMIKDTLKDMASISRYNGIDNISISIQKQAGANTLKTAKSIYETIDQLKLSLPPGVEIDVVTDQSIYIKNSINELRNNALQGGVLAFIILLIFLRSVKGSLIVTFGIPIAILFTLIIMYFMGLTLNMMSLGGLALGVGMLVDSGIVTIENIFRRRQQAANISQQQVSQEGTEEITRALFASTLTSIAVFFPLAYVVGMAGQLFKELAITVSFALLGALLLAISLIPIFMAYGKIRLHISQDRPAQSPGAVRDQPRNYFFIFLIIGLIIGIFFASVKLFLSLDREFLPKLDQRQFIIKLDLSGGARIKVTNRVVQRIEQVLLSIPDIKDVTVNIGSDKETTLSGTVELLESNQARMFINLQPLPEYNWLKFWSREKPADDKYRPTSEVVRDLRQRLLKEDLENAELEYILQESVFKAVFTGTAPIVVEVKGFEPHILEQIVQEAEKRFKQVEGIFGLKNTLSKSSPETKLKVDKDRAALYQLSVNQIANVAHAAVKGVVATKFKEQGREIDIRVRLREEDRADFVSVGRLLLVTPIGLNIFLDQVASMVQGVGPTEIKRLDKERVVLLSANIYQRPLNDIVKEIEQHITDIRGQIPANYSISLAGENKEVIESFKSLRFALILALILVYMIMASQFESLLHPFIIMFTVPLSLIGVAIALFITKTAISVVVLMGFIMLGGIVVNNGILLVDFMNNARSKGAGIFEAAVESSKARMRPVCMTALTTIFGLVPLALGLGEGGELRAPLAITVMGGLISATFLTLVFVPCVYIIIEKAKEFIVSIIKPVVTEKIATAESGGKTEVSEAADIPAREVKSKPHFLPEESVESVGREIRLNERQREAWKYIKSAGRITKVEYIIKFKVSLVVAEEDLQTLFRLKLIRELGGKTKYYEPS
ncbi:MAG: efflux RND transporter permease subunit [Candidatus Omnitrophota bacterium]